MGAILALIGALLKLLGLGAEAARQARDEEVGADLAAGRAARETLDDTHRAIAARDAVVPLRPDGLRVDGTADPDQRD